MEAQWRNHDRTQNTEQIITVVRQIVVFFECYTCIFPSLRFPLIRHCTRKRRHRHVISVRAAFYH